MQKAIDLAWKYQSLTFPNPPVGAVIIDENNNLIASGVHKGAGKPHAELDAVANALNVIDKKDPNQLHEIICKNYKNYKSYYF